MVIQGRIEERVQEANREIQKKRTVSVRARLERLFRDISSNLAVPDDEGLAREFKAFYTMYVWQRERIPAVRKSPPEGAREPSVSIHAVSGGLPSLGKRAK